MKMWPRVMISGTVTIVAVIVLSVASEVLWRRHSNALAIAGGALAALAAWLLTGHPRR